MNTIVDIAAAFQQKLHYQQQLWVFGSSRYPRPRLSKITVG